MGFGFQRDENPMKFFTAVELLALISKLDDGSHN